MLANLNHPSAVAVCLHDAPARRTDPTGTFKLRRKLTTELDRRWRGVELSAKDLIVTNDMFALGSSSSSIGLMLSLFGARSVSGLDAHKLKTFQHWFDALLARLILEGEGAYLRPLIGESYWAGVRRVAKLMGNADYIAHKMRINDKVDTLWRVASIELQGVVEAVSQQVLRAAGDAILKKSRPMILARELMAIVRKVGVARSRALIQVIAVKAHSEGSLDALEVAGVTHVGLVTETIRARPVHDVMFKDAKRRKGPGAFSKKKTPSKSTIGRIRRVQRELEKGLPQVNVLTAGDNKVCYICEEIEANGPYTIDGARGLIPAHINCRCAFVPADDTK